MKSITTYINEKLIVNKNTRTKPEEKVCPKSRDELRKIINSKIITCKGDTLDLSNIDTSKITHMGDLFANKFNKTKITAINLSGWDVSNVENMYAMFENCSELKEIYGLDEWSIDNLSIVDRMFYNCKNLKMIYGDLNSWADRIKEIKILSYMFYNCPNLEIDLSSWDIENHNGSKYKFNYNSDKIKL